MVRTGITDKTPQRYIVDAGEVRVNYVDADNPGKLLGATLDGNEFVIEPEYRDPRPDGARGKIKGLRSLIDISIQLTANMFEVTRETLLKGIPGASGGVEGNHFVITPSLDIEDEDYIDNVALIGSISGSDKGIIIILKNVLADEGITLSFADRDDVLQPIMFSAHFDPEDLDEVPYEIRYPAEIVT